MLPLLIIGGAVALVMFFLRPASATATPQRVAEEKPSTMEQVASKAGSAAIAAGGAAALAAGKAGLLTLFGPAAAAPVIAAPLLVEAPAALGLVGAPVAAEAGIVTGAGAGAAATEGAALGVAGTAGVVALFAAPVILAMIFGARAGAKKAEAAMGASRGALEAWPEVLETISSRLDAAIQARDYRAFMETLPWDTITAAASYGGGSTRGVDFTVFKDANKAAFGPLLQAILPLAPVDVIQVFKTQGAAYPGGPPAPCFSSFTEFPGVILLQLRHEMLWPGTLAQRARECVERSLYVPDSK